MVEHDVDGVDIDLGDVGPVRPPTGGLARIGLADDDGELSGDVFEFAADRIAGDRVAADRADRDLFATDLVDDAPPDDEIGDQIEAVTYLEDDEVEPAEVAAQRSERYGDRVNGWVRPHYEEEPEPGEYWTPIPENSYADAGYGWPVPVERPPRCRRTRRGPVSTSSRSRRPSRRRSFRSGRRSSRPDASNCPAAGRSATPRTPNRSNVGMTTRSMYGRDAAPRRSAAGARTGSPRRCRRLPTPPRCCRRWTAANPSRPASAPAAAGDAGHPQHGLPQQARRRPGLACDGARIAVLRSATSAAWWPARWSGLC